MAEKNSLWKNIRKKAEQNRKTGAKPKKPTAEMLRQERKIKAKQYPNGGPVGDDGLYNMQRALELGYTPDETGHWPSVDSETGAWLKSKEHPTAWMEYMHGYALNPEVQKQYQHPVVNPEGYFGENQLQYNKKAEGGFTGEDDDVFKSNQNQGATVGKTSQDWLANWVQDPEFANRLNRNFPSSAGDLEKKIYGVKEARERASAANLKNINKVIPDIVSDIYDTQFLYNTNPEINTGLLSSYKSRLEDPKSIKALEKNLSTNPQGFTDEQGRIIITNEANTQYGPQSVGVHELIHKVSERDKTLDKLFRGKFQTPSQDRIDANYDKDEMYPFLMQMRFDNKFQPGEEITPERLKQIRDSGYRNHLFRYYNDDEISKYLNTLASNQTQAPIQYAAQGGKLYAEGDSIDPPSGTRYITPTRQDSLNVFNNAVAVKAHYDAMVKRNLYQKPKIRDAQSGKDLYDRYKKGTESNKLLKEAIKDISSMPSYIPEYKTYHNIDRLKLLSLVKEAVKNANYDDPYKVKIYDLYPTKVDISAPATIIDSRISPQATIDYKIHDNLARVKKDLPGGMITGIPMYDPLAVAPWDMLNEKQRAERINKYGLKGTPYKLKKNVESQPKPILPQLDKLQPKQYTNSNQQPSIVGNVQNISPSEINMDKFYEGQYEKYRRSPYEDPMYRVWVPGQQMQIVSKEEFKKLNDQYALKDLEQKAQGGYMYDGGEKVLNRDGLLIAPTLPEFEVIENLTDEEKFRIEKYNERLNQQKAFQEKWYPGQEYDPTNIERRAGIYADDATAKYILNNHASRNDFANRQDYLRSFTPYQKNIIERSNYAGNFEPDMGSRFRRGLGLLAGTRSSLTNPDPDLSAEDYANRNFLTNLGDIISPITYPLNVVRGTVTGSGKSALRGETANPWVDATDMALGNEEDVWKYNVEGDIAIDPLNFAGTGIGSSSIDDLGKVGKYLTTQTPLKETWRLNPFAFKPQEGMMYRGLGEEGFADAIQSGVFRPKQYNYTPGRSLAENVTTPKQFGSTFYAPAEKFGVVENYGPSYLAEVPFADNQFTRRYGRKNWSWSTPKQIPIEEGRILQKDWLRRYKQIETSKQLPNIYKSVLPAIRTSTLDNVNKNSTTGLIGSLDNYPKKYRQITESDAIAKAKNGIIERQIGFLTPDEIAKKVKDSDALTQDVIDINREWGLNLDNVAKVKYDEHVKTLKKFSDEENLIKDEFAKLQDAYNNNTISKLDYKNGVDDLNNRYRDYIVRFSKTKSDFDILLKNNPVLDKRYEEKLRALYDKAGIKQPDFFKLPNDLIENPNQILYPFSGQDISQFNFPQDIQNSIMSPYNAGFNRDGYSITKGDLPQSISYYEEILPDKLQGKFSFINPKNWFSKKQVDPIIYKEIRNNFKSPESLFQTVGHEDAHTWQRINDWGNEIFTHYNPNYKYFTNHKNNPLSKEFADHMVEPTLPNSLKPNEPTYDTWLSGTKELHSDLQSARAQLVRDLRSVHGFTTKEAVAHLKQNYEIYLEYLIDTYDLKRFFKPNTPMETMKRLVNYLPAAIGVTATGAVGAKMMQNNQPEQQSYGGPVNPYMYYAGGPMYYGDGGKILKHIGAGAYGILEGGLDTLTFGATDQLTDKGFDWLTKVGNKNLDLNDPKNAKFLRTQQQIRGYSNVAGAIGTAAFTGQWGSAIGQGAKGINTAFQATEGLSDDFKKWSNIGSQAIGIGAGLAGGSLNVESASKAGQAAANFGSQVSKFSPYINQGLGMIGGNQQSLLEQAEARQDYLNSPEYLAMKERENQAYVNQGLSFASTGGNINNSLNLQNSMRGKYNNYKRRYSKGGTFQKFGINEIPDSAGYHHENAYGGVPIGPNAMAEGGEFVLDNNYVVSDEVDGMNTQTDEFGRTMAQNLKRDLSKYTMRDLNSKNRDSLRRPMDPLAEQTINQIKQKAMMETEMARAEAQAKEQERQAMVEGALQYAAAGGKLNKDITKIVEEEYAAAYGGYINPKKYKGLNMPYSSGGKLPKEVLRARVESHMSPEQADAYVENYAKGGGIHIKESKKGTFTAAAKKHGKSVQEFARQVLANKGNYSSAMVKKANFARNAAKWHHAEGGPMDPPDKWSLPIASRSNVQQGSRNIITAGAGNNLPFTEQGTRIINEYDNGLPNDTSYSYMTPTENFFYNTGQNQPDGKPIMNYQGSNPNPNINDYLPKIKGLSRYAHGGPVVSNVNQDFDLYAQNRGGMMMADGGMMPQDNSMYKQIAAALQQGAKYENILSQLIESGMDPQQAQAMLQAIMGKMQTQAQVPTEAPMMAMGGTMYAPGGGVSNFQHMKNMLLNKTYRNAYNLAKGYNTIKPKDYPNLFTPIEGEKTGPTGNFGEWAGFYPATEDEAKKYQGYDPTKVNQSTSTSSLGTGTGNENIFGDDKLGKALAIGQAAIPLGEAAYHIFNKPKHIKAPVIQPATVDYSASRIIDQRQTDMAENAYLNRLRNSSSTSGMFANNAKEYLLQSNAAQAGRNAISVQDQMNKNAEETARANALNAQYGFSADQLNYDIDQARIGNIFGALNNAATTGFQGYSDISNRKLQEIQARSTQSANVTPITGTDGRIYMATKGADGYYFNGVKIAELPK